MEVIQSCWEHCNYYAYYEALEFLHEEPTQFIHQLGVGETLNIWNFEEYPPVWWNMGDPAPGWAEKVEENDRPVLSDIFVEDYEQKNNESTKSWFLILCMFL